MTGQLSLGALGGIQLAPDALDEQRGAWCSPPEWCERVTERGPFDLDPFTNPRSTLAVTRQCMLERGDDGFGLDMRAAPGAHYVNTARCQFCSGTGRRREVTASHCECSMCGYHVATAETRVWIQPDYGFVLEALAHYGHTRFVALLRLDTSTLWFALLALGLTADDVRDMKPQHRTALGAAARVQQPLCEVVMVPRSDRLEFVPPPGVKASSNPYPHGLYYARAADVTPSVRAHAIAWPTAIYPWSADPLGLLTLGAP